MDSLTSRVTPRDALGYVLAYLVWVVLSAVALLAILLLRSVIAPTVALLLLPNPWYQLHSTELSGVVTSVDRLGLIILAIAWVIYVVVLEEYLRTSIAAVRQRRAKASLSAPGTRQNRETTRLQRWGLDLFVRRLPRAVLFPVVLLLLYLLMQVVLKLL